MLYNRIGLALRKLIETILIDQQIATTYLKKDECFV